MSPCYRVPPGYPYYPDTGNVKYATEQECNNNCSELGACCRANACTQETRCQCEQNNSGSFQGLGVPCSAAPCPCVIKPISSIEVTITAEDVVVQNQCRESPLLGCPVVVVGHTSFFPGSLYAGTYSLTKLPENNGIWVYSWAASGQLCGGSIVATVGRGTVQIFLNLIAIDFQDYSSTTSRPPAQLTCQEISQTASGCGFSQPYLQRLCYATVEASLPCKSSEASVDALPVCLSVHAWCGKSSNEKSGIGGNADPACAALFDEVCISSVSIEYET